MAEGFEAALLKHTLESLIQESVKHSKTEAGKESLNPTLNPKP